MAPRAALSPRVPTIQPGDAGHREETQLQVYSCTNAVLNGTLENAFRHRYPGFRPANDDKAIALAS
jgi:hypothetical protein